MNEWPALLNIAGLVIDMAGVIGLFFTATKALSKIPRARSFSSIEQLVKHTGGRALDEAFNNLVEHINNALKRNAEENELIKRRANCWLIPVIIGFLMQLAASVWQLCMK